jgi:hypothetical protein
MVVVKTELATACGHSVDMHPEPNFFHRGALHVKSHPVAVYTGLEVFNQSELATGVQTLQVPGEPKLVLVAVLPQASR